MGSLGLFGAYFRGFVMTQETPGDAVITRIADTPSIPHPRRISWTPTNQRSTIRQRFAILDDYQGVDYDYAPWDQLAADGIDVTVCGTGGSPAAAPELTWALVLAAARNLQFEGNAMRAGRLQSTVGFELAGKTLGILGKICTKVAGYAHAFGMDVIACSPNLARKPQLPPASAR